MSAHAQSETGFAAVEGGAELRRRLRRSLRWQKARALFLIAPLLLFILVTFIAPIADMLFRSVENDLVAETLPDTVEALRAWDAGTDSSPGLEVFRALYFDLSLAVEQKKHTRVGSRLNYESPGIASLFRRSGRALRSFETASFKDHFLAADPAWESVDRLTELFSDAAVAASLPESARAFGIWAERNARRNRPPADYLYVMLADELLSGGGGSAPAGVSGDHAALISAVLPGLGDIREPDWKAAFIESDDDWADPDLWQTIRIFSPPLTEGYFLNAVDLKKGIEGIESRPESERIYVVIFIRTLVMSLTITLACILLGYPVAYLLASLPISRANLLMILVLLPFWTSLLVRTSAWKVLLQQQGVINDILVAIGIIADESRLVMINNQFGTIVAMTHILLPFMILPMFAVMKTIPPSYVRAARSLGATSWTAFRRIYFPQTLPGIGAGSVLVFILAIGYYITPELVGGTKGTFISNRIAYHISTSLNWGLGAALGTILLAAVLLLYWIYDRIVGIDNVKLG
ncbi:MAG: ABC transporter permease [Paracoccaceae bacterium]|nr:ABC transporter permease [Paracoccaceae bacterium]